MVQTQALKPTSTSTTGQLYIHFYFFQILHESVRMFRETGFLASPLSQLWEGDHTLNLETTCTNRQIHKCIYGLQTVVQVVRQWLSQLKREFLEGNLTFIQSMKLDVSAAGALEESWRAAGLQSTLETQGASF